MVKRLLIALFTAVCWLMLTGTVSAIPLPPTGTLTQADGILIGSSHEDWVGSGGIQRLPSGNVLVLSPDWNGGRGAVTCLTPSQLTATGTPIQVSASNSLVGSQAGDGIDMRVIQLGDGNYVVKNPLWDNGGIVDAGAVTWVDGNTCFPHGVSGRGAVVSASNSLVGSREDDKVGDKVNALTSTPLGAYIVSSPYWDSDTVTDASALTLVSSPEKRAGVVSASNSLIGTTSNDMGDFSYVVVADGKIFLRYVRWDNPLTTAQDVGALVFMPINTPKVGTISASNALIGSTTADYLGNGILAQTSDANYIVTSPFWDNGAVTNVGAITWINGQNGLVGEINATNSMLGTTAGDSIGNGQFLTLANGNYVVSSPNWDNGALVDAGAVYLGDGSKKVTGTLSAAKALVGDHTNDRLRNLFISEGSSFFVHANNWNNSAGALRRFNGTSSVVGTISPSNALVGATANDQLGSSGIIQLTNGHYVVGTPNFDNGVTIDVGAVTWVNKDGSTVGTIKPSNSLIGTSTSDWVGYSLFALTNGNYVVGSRYWDNSGIIDAGAVTWRNGSASTSGVVSTANSLVGSSADDRVGKFIRTLSNGNYLAASDIWDNGSAVDAGAVTWLTGSGTTSAVVSTANSIVGTTSGDTIGIYLSSLPNGHYLAASPNWDNGGAVNVGAVTWISSTEPTVGAVSAANSLIGRMAEDRVGAYAHTVLANGNYVLPSHSWDSDSLPDVGAITWCNGFEPCTGVVNVTNSLIGAESGVSPFIKFITYPNGDFMVHSFTSLSLLYSTTTLVYGDGTRPLTGVIGPDIGLVGPVSTLIMPDYSLIVSDFRWKNGANQEVGIVARIDGPVNRLQNASYETAGSPAKYAANWKLNAGATAGDKRTCNTPAKPVTRTEGNCVFQFSSSNTPAKARTLKQTFNLPDWANVGDVLTLTADVEGNKVSGSTRKIILSVRYDNNIIDKATLTIPAGTYGYQTLVGTVKLTRPVKNITVTINVGTAKGRIRIDNMTLRDSTIPLRFPALGENTTRDGASTFGLPEAPDGFRH